MHTGCPSTISLMQSGISHRSPASSNGRGAVSTGSTAQVCSNRLTRLCKHLATRGVAGFSLGHQRLPATVELALSALLLGLLLGLPVGIVSAVRRNTGLDRTVRVLAVTSHSTPNFFLGMLLILLFAVSLGWLPSFGMGGWRHALLPTITLSTYVISLVSRVTRASMLEVLDADYVRTARAKGLSERLVIWRHALRNALIPIITVVGLQFGNLVGGAIVTETVFAWPGIGTAAYQ